jgi:glutamate/aspartate transport system substrate-binding protein
MMFRLLSLAFLCAAVPAMAAAPEGPTLQRIVASKTFDIGYRDSSVPFSYVDSSGNPIGYSIDICRQIAASIKASYHLDHLNVRFIPITPQTRLALIANGTIDIACESAAITLSRYQQVDFSTPVFIAGSRLMVKANSSIRSLDDLNGKVLTGIPGTTNLKAAIADIQKKHLKVQILPAVDHAQAMLNLEQGRADASVADDIDLYGTRSTLPDPKDYVIVGPTFTYDPYAMILPKNDDDYRAVVDGVISQMITSGQLASLYNKWFVPGPTHIDVPMSDLTKAAMELGAYAN